MKKYIISSLFIFNIVSILAAAEPEGTKAPAAPEQLIPAPAVSWKEAVSFAKQNLPLEGTLETNADGAIYLKVDERFIHSLFRMLRLKKEGYRKPSFFQDPPNSCGAHIKVFRADEKVALEEIGQTFRFNPSNIVITRRAKTDAELVVLQVRSPDLEKLREKYGLSPKLPNREFSITIGKKIRAPKNVRPCHGRQFHYKRKQTNQENQPQS